MSPRKPTQQPVVLTDPRAIRALAHPARLLVIDRLYAGEVATSTELAEAAGLSPSAMSYHLRALEKYGIVERADLAGDARQRPWKARGTTLQIRSGNPRTTAAAETALIDTMLDAERRELGRFLARQADEPVEWRDAVTIHTGRIEVTVEQLGEVDRVVREALNRFATPENPPSAGSRKVRYALTLVPAAD